MYEDFDIRCNLDWTEDSPKLIITFSQDIDTKLVMDIADIIEKTINKKLNCVACQVSEVCDKKLN